MVCKIPMFLIYKGLKLKQFLTSIVGKRSQQLTEEDMGEN